MIKRLLLFLLLAAASALGQQQNFNYVCINPPGTSATISLHSLANTGVGNCTTNHASPNVANDYPQPPTAGFDDIVIANAGHITNLRVEAVVSSTLVTCSDDTHAVHVSDGDRVGAYYVTTTGVLTIYDGSTATALTCDVPNVVFPGTVVTWIQVEFFKK